MKTQTPRLKGKNKQTKRLEGAPLLAICHSVLTPHWGVIRHRPCEPHHEGRLETPAWCPSAITNCTTCVTALLSLMTPFSELLNLRLALGGPPNRTRAAQALRAKRQQLC